MKSIDFNELGVDPLPVENARIIFFNKDDGYGLFERMGDCTGEVGYSYHDLHDKNYPDDPDEMCYSIKQATDQGYKITLQECDVYDDDYVPSAITLSLNETGEQLLLGTHWVYEHEILPFLGDVEFPFQCPKYYEVALEQGWINRLTRENVEVVGKHMYGPQAGEEDIRHFRHDVVEFNGKTYKLIWHKINYGVSFQEYSEVT